MNTAEKERIWAKVQRRISEQEARGQRFMVVVIPGFGLGVNLIWGSGEWVIGAQVGPFGAVFRIRP